MAIGLLVWIILIILIGCSGNYWIIPAILFIITVGGIVAGISERH